MVVFPNAKINIGLDILRKRADGYHDIESVMVPVKWRDILEIVESKGTQTTLTVSGRGVNCPPEKNLVMKAYVATKQRHDIPNVDIYLNKIIPEAPDWAEARLTQPSQSSPSTTFSTSR
jgi:4-diphosphocytidyl-2-C-methyl-D-erythritol kinase